MGRLAPVLLQDVALEPVFSMAVSDLPSTACLMRVGLNRTRSTSLTGSAGTACSGKSRTTKNAYDGFFRSRTVLDHAGWLPPAVIVQPRLRFGVL